MPSSQPPASPLFLREAEVRRGIELLHFGYTHLMRALDAQLGAAGLGRAHQRALYFIARQPGLSVGALLTHLGITKQALGRVVTELSARDLIEVRVGRDDRRQRVLRLTPAGAALESALFEALRERLGAAYAHAGQQAVTGFWQVLEGLIDPPARETVARLGH